VYMLHRNGRVEQKLESERRKETKYEDATRSYKMEVLRLSCTCGMQQIHTSPG
jgi:hypothetical protein